ncbi:hypothetical protein GLOIN_2v1789985 [Rhizophagus irregularis DAOM 181602=DAOM 197198]|uniref:Crinkler family protein n=1 Tax=Rhizophagus irregularis (strain DAOM 181602 / DAOM 197198 / MUCL 43194) TaxID=747089 RepID=A0A2P4P040_RHIID|nr:hypothetical protein GLOIN_2v1789985 [Rhizophagus irregularis DAOM 181602=DAOM 197198]POG58734.1 hypothetical protein GLOIN_2v1789985 [Rhizophagus irregularis DAOM 181602=DAOM 197198]|eukprot:XP_025165600.1 hypothetical protein GLOIN_2v1789985 [Rhizophagus irregularis DAOM 181602=DAOM 197198]
MTVTSFQAIRKISKYFLDPPAEEHIHVLVEPPVSTTASNKVLELREKLASLQVTQQSETDEGFVNIEHATLEGLKTPYVGCPQHPALENDGAVFNMLNDSGKYFPHNDQDLRDILQMFVSKNNLKFTVFIETPSKAFSDWTLSSVYQLYGLGGESEEPSMTSFPVFSCGNVKPSQESLGLMAELKSITPINLLSIEATKSLYVYSYLLAGANNFKGKFYIRPQKVISGPNGHGPLDFAIDLR